jgi:hypothetical protein
MGVGIEIEVSVGAGLVKIIGGADNLGKKKPEAVLSRIMQDRLQEALLRIKRNWPIKSGRSWLAWNIYRVKPLTWRIVNQAESDYGEYAGYVHRRGTDPSQTILKTEIPGIIKAAMQEVRTDVLKIRQTGKITQLPTLRQTVVDQLREAIAKKLLDRTRNRR